MKEFIQDNITAFYNKIGETIPSEYFHSDKLTWLNTGNGNWPNMIYNNSFNEDELNEIISQTVAEIKNKTAPPFWLVNDSNLDEILTESLKKNGMRPVFHWTGMGLAVSQNFTLKLSKNTKIISVTNQDELEDWLSIVNTALMTSNKVQQHIFADMLLQDNCQLYLVLENNIPVATGLAYFSDNHCGVYMIATLNEHRKKGYGSAVTKHCMNVALQKGITNIVLHASKQGVSIYEKMGFKKYCTFNILWMLGKDFK